MEELPDTLNELKEICNKLSIKSWGTKLQIKKRIIAKRISSQPNSTTSEVDYTNMLVAELRSLCEKRELSKGKSTFFSAALLFFQMI